MNQEHQGPTHPGGSSQTLQPGRFPDQHPLPSRHTLRLGIVATWIRPSHCTRSHLQSGSFLLPRALARSCPLCQPWTGDVTTSDDGASLPHVPSEVLSTGPWMLGSLGVDPRPKVFLIEPEHSFPESFENPKLLLVLLPRNRTRNRKCD